GVGEIVDYMPVHAPHAFDGLIRNVKVMRGNMSFRMECRPAFNYARDPHTTEIIDSGARFRTPRLSMGLGSAVPLQPLGTGVSAEFSLEEGQSTTFVFRALNSDGDGPPNLGLHEKTAQRLFHDTIEYWRNWISKSTYRGRWREMVHRS